MKFRPGNRLFNIIFCVLLWLPSQAQLKCHYGNSLTVVNKHLIFDSIGKAIPLNKNHEVLFTISSGVSYKIYRNFSFLFDGKFSIPVLKDPAFARQNNVFTSWSLQYDLPKKKSNYVFALGIFAAEQRLSLRNLNLPILNLNNISGNEVQFSNSNQGLIFSAVVQTMKKKKIIIEPFFNAFYGLGSRPWESKNAVLPSLSKDKLYGGSLGVRIPFHLSFQRK